MPPSKYVPTLNAGNNMHAHPTSRLNSFVQNTLSALGYVNTKIDHSEDSYGYGAPAPTPRTQPHTSR